jgi:hypothetical protein
MFKTIESPEMKSVQVGVFLAFLFLLIGVEATNCNTQSRFSLSSSITRATSHLFGDHSIIAYGLQESEGTKSLCRKYSEIIHNPRLEHIHVCISNAVSIDSRPTLHQIIQHFII